MTTTAATDDEDKHDDNTTARHEQDEDIKIRTNIIKTASMNYAYVSTGHHLPAERLRMFT